MLCLRGLSLWNLQWFWRMFVLILIQISPTWSHLTFPRLPLTSLSHYASPRPNHEWLQVPYRFFTAKRRAAVDLPRWEWGRVFGDSHGANESREDQLINIFFRGLTDGSRHWVGQLEWWDEDSSEYLVGKRATWKTSFLCSVKCSVGGVVNHLSGRAAWSWSISLHAQRIRVWWQG